MSAPRSQTPSLAFTSLREVRLPLCPGFPGRLTTLQASLDVADRPLAPPRFDAGISTDAGPFRRSPCSPFHRGRCTADNRRTALTTDQDHKPLVLHAPTDAEVLNEESINPFENSSFDSASRQTVDRWIQAKTKPLLLAYFM